VFIWRFAAVSNIPSTDYKADLSYTWQFWAQFQIHVNHKFLFAKSRSSHKTCRSYIHFGTVSGFVDIAPSKILFQREETFQIRRTQNNEQEDVSLTSSRMP
jgi:hypothetical protein